VSVFDDLVGQERVVEQLRAAATEAGRVVAGDRGSGAMTHAWLFTGPPGSGRSIAARAFAAALQCPSGGCGQCVDCMQARGGTHVDVSLVVPEGLSIKVGEDENEVGSARYLVARLHRRPTRGRWLVTVIEDADRLTDEAANALLKSVEEPPPRGVLLLCAPSVEDLLPTIRSRCRLVALRTPPSDAVARVLVERDGVDPAMAAFAAQAAQGHIGRAKRLATDEEARRERRDVLSLPRSLQGVGSALSAAADLVDAAKHEADTLTKGRDAAEKESLSTALGVGATGKGVTGGARGSAGAFKELEKRQKSRATRTQRDALDRALVDLAAFYRDVLQLQLGTGTPLVHGDLGDQAATIARATTPESTLRRIDAVLACRQALDANVAQLLAVEAMALALRTG
jgi:DNA polymerase-3 subunit delta'